MIRLSKNKHIGSLGDIAAQLDDVTLSGLKMGRSRHPDTFPKPLGVIGGQQVYALEHIATWAQKHKYNTWRQSKPKRKAS